MSVKSTGQLGFGELAAARRASIRAISCGVETMRTPSIFSFWTRVSWMSPVPGLQQKRLEQQQRTIARTARPLLAKTRQLTLKARPVHKRRNPVQGPNPAPPSRRQLPKPKLTRRLH